MINALTIDVEDLYNLFARQWLNREVKPTERVVENTLRLLELLAEHDTRSTCFVLGEVAEKFPQLVRDIAASGHELGVHGYYHKQVFRLTPEAFRREISDAKALIEDIAGVEVQGHRAPAFSIVPQTRWALDVLAEVGFWYDSSIFPFRGRRYGWPGFPLDIHTMTLAGDRSIVEAPMSTVSILGMRLPACGGGYLRHFPYRFTHWAMRRIQRARPAIVYIHPHEIGMSPAPAWFRAALAAAGRRAKRFHALQERNHQTMESKLSRVLRSFRFAPLGEVIKQAMDSGTTRAGASFM